MEEITIEPGHDNGYDVIVHLGGTAYRLKSDIVARVMHGFLPQPEFVGDVMDIFKPGQIYWSIDPRAKPVRIIFHKGEVPDGFLQKLQQIMTKAEEGRSLNPK